MEARRVLITGGAGFLGAYLAESYRKAGMHVRLLDTVSSPDRFRDSSVEYVCGDVRDSSTVNAALEGVDSVIHTAFASPRQSREALKSVNTDGMKNIGEAALRQGVRRLILISSTIVLREPKVHPFLKNSPLSRFDLYRSSRVRAEEIAAQLNCRGLSSAIVRPKTFLGPGRLSALAIIFERIRLGNTVPVLGGGSNRYQLLDIRDMAEGIRLLEAGDSRGVFYFGAREFQTVRQDLDTVIAHAQTGARLQFISGRVACAALRGMELAGMVPLSEWHYTSARGVDSVVDISRAERELGWRPNWSNAQALIDAYDWYSTTKAKSGTVKSTHPVPMMHRVLEKFFL